MMQNFGNIIKRRQERLKVSSSDASIIDLLALAGVFFLLLFLPEEGSSATLGVPTLGVPTFLWAVTQYLDPAGYSQRKERSPSVKMDLWRSVCWVLALKSLPFSWVGLLRAILLIRTYRQCESKKVIIHQKRQQ